jgi:hypothetical protein
MKIDSSLNMPRMSTNVTTARVTPDTSFSARVQSGVGTAANMVAGGVGMAANLVPGGSVVSAAVSSLTTFGNASGSGAAPYVGAALSSGGVPANTTVGSGGIPGGTSSTGGTNSVNVGGNSNVGGEYSGEMQSMFAEQKKLLGVQIAMQKENQVFSTISNVLKTRHDTSKNAIGNIR